VDRNGDLLRGTNEKCRVPRRVGCCHEQQPLGIAWQLLDPLPEARFNPRWQRSVAGEPEPPGESPS
jgi:hypothetical protein